MLNLKRVYEKTEKIDGYRILVDRLWPRGILKQKAKIDLWLKEIAPSNELRKWFGHDSTKWPEFQRRYRKELSSQGEAIAKLRNAIRKEKVVTLLFSAHDAEHNNAVILMKMLKRYVK